MDLSAFVRTTPACSSSFVPGNRWRNKPLMRPVAGQVQRNPNNTPPAWKFHEIEQFNRRTISAVNAQLRGSVNRAHVRPDLAGVPLRRAPYPLEPALLKPAELAHRF